MINREVTRWDEEQVLAEYPISGLVPGWYFRFQEISSGAFWVEGTDLCGRRVSQRGSDPDRILNDCISDANLLPAVDE